MKNGSETVVHQVKWSNHGPPQVWQDYLFSWVSDVKPLTRLDRAAHRGLLVGKGARLCGGLTANVAQRFEGSVLAYLDRDSNGVITRAYPCQYSFDFYGDGYGYPRTDG